MTEYKTPNLPDFEVALLLLLARNSLNAEQADWAKNTFRRCVDFTKLIELGTSSFALPFLAKHSSTIGLSDKPPSELSVIHQDAMKFAAHNLFMVAELQSFHKACLAPVTSQYAYLKGPLLASHFYGSYGVRTSRDIDLVVANDHFEPLLRSAWSKGYVPMLAPGQKTLATSERDFRALLDYSTNHIVLLSPNGAHIEVHKEIDPYQTIPSAELLRNRVSVTLGQTQFFMVSPALLFTYVCLHHARHYFSRAHWVADISTISSHPSFSKDDAMQQAEKFGLETLIDTCMKFDTQCGAPWTWRNQANEDDAHRLFRFCSEVFGKDPTKERSVTRRRERKGDYFEWENNSRARNKILRAFLGRRSSFQSEKFMMLSYYTKCPLPRYLQFLYILPRIYDGLRSRFKEA